jgi:hypothetical protein
MFVLVKVWSLTLREEPRRKVFENRVLRIILGPKGVEIMGLEKIS